MANLIAYVATRMFALIAILIMTKKELMKLRTPEWWRNETDKRGRVKLNEMYWKMIDTISSLKPGQCIDVSKIKPANQELFYVVATDHMVCNPDFVFSNDYGKLYRTEVDEEGCTILTSAYR